MISTIPGNTSHRRFWSDLSESALRSLRKSNGSIICRDGFEFMNSRGGKRVHLAGMARHFSIRMVNFLLR